MGKSEPNGEPGAVRFAVYLTPEKRTALRRVALDEGMPATHLVERLIDEYLARRAKKGGK